ncbi:MAG: glycoside hydrolase family 97 catalytic domain-containing protein [Spirosomataceae bacterium]
MTLNKLLLITLIPFYTLANWQVTSPNGKIRANLFLNSSRTLYYNVEYIENNQVERVIDDSKLSIHRDNAFFWFELGFVSASTQTIDENYSMITGKKSNLSNNANEITLRFTGFQTSALVDISFRVYDDGVAFKYHFPETTGYSLTVFHDQSEVKLPTGGQAWLQPYSGVPYYEKRYSEYQIGQYGPNANGESGWCLPALFHTQNHWILVSESNITERNHISHLDPNANDNTYRFTPPIQDDLTNYPNTISTRLPWTSAWKVIAIGKTPHAIIESNIVNHVSTPSVVSNTSWIKPGRATWSWWSDLGSSANVQRQKDYANLAHTLGLPYLVIDGTWETMGNTNFANVVRYADSLGVKVWVWYDAGGLCDQIGGDCNLMRDSTRRRAEFARIKQLGVVGIKLDFFKSDKNTAVKQYLDVFKDAATYELMLNLHGCTIPVGWQRTYPHVLSFESVMGAEMLLFNEQFRQDSPPHNVNLAFTRNVVGSMDYTPGVLSTNRVEHNTTSAHELALCSIYEAGFTALPDFVQSYLDLSATAKSVLGGIPAAWDETRFIEGQPNDYVVLARRKGKDWYISGINGKNSPRSVTLNPTFLQQATYQKQTVLDGSTARQITSTDEVYNPANPVTINMLPYGGFTVVFKLTCLDNLLISSTLSQPNPPYKARSIEANNIIQSGANITYSANNAVQLNAGFNAQSGSVFKAEIGGCQN